MVTEVKVRTTRVYDDIMVAFVERKWRILLEGGTYSSKTWSTLQALIDIAELTSTPLDIHIVSESLPHLKQGAMKDFFDILNETKENNKYFNIQESRYTRPNWKGVIQFYGAESEGKAMGPRRDILFINQGEHINWEVARQLDTRTERFTIVDWNPTSEFWVYQYESSPGVVVPGWLRDGNPDNAYCHSTYEDALDVISNQKVKDIESYRDTDPNWWRIFGLGLVGKIEGLVYPYFEQVKALPKGDKFYGLDFGYTNDPTVLTCNVIIGDSLYSQELIYQTGLTNDAIAREMDLLKIRHDYDEIFADAQEPKSIEEIYLKSFNIKPCEKGPDSVEYGHQKVKQFKQYWTEDSINCIKEQRNFRYIQDKEGKFTDKTTHKWSHGMDSRRYAVSSHIQVIGGSNKIHVLAPRG